MWVGRSGGAAPGVAGLSSHFVRQGSSQATQQPAIPGLGPQSSQGQSSAWRKTLPAIFQRQQQQQMAQPAGSGGTQHHPASNGSASGATSGAVAPSSSHGARPTASSSHNPWHGECPIFSYDAACPSSPPLCPGRSSAEGLSQNIYSPCSSLCRSLTSSRGTHNLHPPLACWLSPASESRN